MKEKITIQCEIGHWAKRITSSQLSKSDSGFTHAWKVFVIGRKGPLETFVKKVVFRLHPTFPNPVQTVYKPPFELEEKGFGTFPMTIELHFQEQIEQIATFEYELMLMVDKDINCTTIKSFSITNPKPAEFRQKLLDAGGIITTIGDTSEKKDSKRKKEKKVFLGNPLQRSISNISTKSETSRSIEEIISDSSVQNGANSIQIPDISTYSKPVKIDRTNSLIQEKTPIKTVKTDIDFNVDSAYDGVVENKPAEKIVLKISKTPTKPVVTVPTAPEIIVTKPPESKSLSAELFDAVLKQDKDKDSSGSKKKKKKKHKHKKDKNKDDDKSQKKKKRKKDKNEGSQEAASSDHSGSDKPNIADILPDAIVKDSLPFKKRKYDTFEDDSSSSTPTVSLTAPPVDSGLGSSLPKQNNEETVKPKTEFSNIDNTNRDLYDNVFGAFMFKASPEVPLFSLPIKNEVDASVSVPVMSKTDTMEKLFGSRNPELPPTLEAEPPTLSPHLSFGSKDHHFPAELMSQVSVESTGFRPSLKSSRSSIVSYLNSPLVEAEPSTPVTLDSNPKYNWASKDCGLTKSEYDHRFQLCVSAASVVGNLRKEEEIYRIFAKASSGLVGQDGNYATFDLSKLEPESLKKLNTLLLSDSSLSSLKF